MQSVRSPSRRAWIEVNPGLQTPIEDVGGAAKLGVNTKEGDGSADHHFVPVLLSQSQLRTDLATVLAEMFEPTTLTIVAYMKF